MEFKNRAKVEQMLWDKLILPKEKTLVGNGKAVETTKGTVHYRTAIVAIWHTG